MFSIKKNLEINLYRTHMHYAIIPNTHLDLTQDQNHINFTYLKAEGRK